MTHLASLVLVAFVSIASAAPVFAQPTDQPETPGTPKSESVLDVTVDLFGAVDRALGANDPVAERTYWGGNSQLAYEKSSGRFSFGAEAGASVRRLSNVTEGTLPSYSGSLRAAGPLTRRTTWDIQQAFSYGPTNAVPFFGPGDFSVDGVQSVPLVDYRLNDTNRFTSSTRGTLGYAVSRRGSLSGFAGFEHAAAPPSVAGPPSEGGVAEQLVGIPTDTDETSNAAFRRWEIGGRYSYRTTRYTNLYAGYGLTENSVSESSGIAAAPRMHNLDLGIGYGRPLSFSRRTRISAQVGSSIVQDRASSRQWRLNGNASIRHELGRTWLARLGYYRNTEYLPAFADPVMSDAVTFSVGGALSSKASLSLLANYAKGSVGFDSGIDNAVQNNGYNIASTSANFRYALFTQLALYAEYFLFDSDFERGVALTDTQVIGSRRHGVRFGVSIGTGLWGNRRRMPESLDGETTR